MSEPRWKAWLLGGLLTVLVVVGALRAWPIVATWRSGDAPSGDAASTGASDRPAAPREEAVRIDFGGLDQASATPGSEDRNPFQFGVAGPPPAPAGTAPAPVAYLPTPSAAPPPAVEPIPFRFIGTLRTSGTGGVVAVLADDRGVYHGREGEVVEGRYRIVTIGEESIQIERTDGRGRQTIRLTGS